MALIIQSVMVNLASNILAFAALTRDDANTELIVDEATFSLDRLTLGTSPDIAASTTALTITKVGGRYEIAGLTTDNLPNNRSSWSSFGQLCEDVFLGRIPELVGAGVLILDQSAGTLRWGANYSTVDLGSGGGGTQIISGEQAKAGVDFFE